jgi:hypothetical protein
MVFYHRIAVRARQNKQLPVERLRLILEIAYNKLSIIHAIVSKSFYFCPLYMLTKIKTT